MVKPKPCIISSSMSNNSTVLNIIHEDVNSEASEENNGPSSANKECVEQKVLDENISKDTYQPKVDHVQNVETGKDATQKPAVKKPRFLKAKPSIISQIRFNKTSSSISNNSTVQNIIHEKVVNSAASEKNADSPSTSKECEEPKMVDEIISRAINQPKVDDVQNVIHVGQEGTQKVVVKKPRFLKTKPSIISNTRFDKAASYPSNNSTLQIAIHDRDINSVTEEEYFKSPSDNKECKKQKVVEDDNISKDINQPKVDHVQNVVETRKEPTQKLLVKKPKFLKAKPHIISNTKFDKTSSNTSNNSTSQNIHEHVNTEASEINVDSPSVSKECEERKVVEDENISMHLDKPKVDHIQNVVEAGKEAAQKPAVKKPRFLKTKPSIISNISSDKNGGSTSNTSTVQNVHEEHVDTEASERNFDSPSVSKEYEKQKVVEDENISKHSDEPKVDQIQNVAKAGREAAQKPAVKKPRFLKTKPSIISNIRFDKNGSSTSSNSTVQNIQEERVDTEASQRHFDSPSVSKEYEKRKIVEDENISKHLDEPKVDHIQNVAEAGREAAQKPPVKKPRFLKTKPSIISNIKFDKNGSSTSNTSTVQNIHEEHVDTEASQRNFDSPSVSKEYEKHKVVDDNISKHSDEQKVDHIQNVAELEKEAAQKLAVKKPRFLKTKPSIISNIRLDKTSSTTSSNSTVQNIHEENDDIETTEENVKSPYNKECEKQKVVEDENISKDINQPKVGHVQNVVETSKEPTQKLIVKKPKFLKAKPSIITNIRFDKASSNTSDNTTFQNIHEDIITEASERNVDLPAISKECEEQKLVEDENIARDINQPKVDHVQNVVNVEKEATQNPAVKPRHRFIRPKPSIISSIRFDKTDSNSLQNVHEGDVESQKNIESSTTTTPPADEKTFLAPKEVEVTLNETHLTSPIVSEGIDNSSDKGINRLVPSSVMVPAPETEYPVPPPSPSKINRARFKAVPRLDQRRMSCSASESEDESRRHRHRNDSVSSSVSGVPDNLAECMSPRHTKEVNSAIQKKCRRSEQSRKFAEARREFQLKFGKETPNMSKLTMMDLIFYNPTTNPMKGSKKPNISKITETPEKISETVDDPDDKESSDEDGVPAPRVKIDAQGNIIIDEESLVVENKKTKRDRARLEKSTAINLDNRTTYGVFKRTIRSKDWDRTETLRFYKALNTIGTDFSLMCELFPKRTRRELKIKFNKEERVNRTLVDRAMTQPSQFDFDTLVQEAMIEEEEKKVREESDRLAKEKRKKKIEENKNNGKRKREARRKTREDKLRNLTKHMEEEQETQSDSPPAKTAAERPKPKPVNKRISKPEKQRKPKQPRKRKRNILSIMSVLNRDSDSENQVSSDISQSASDDEFPDSSDEIIVDEKPTRYGRIPKKRQAFEPTITSSFTRNKKRKISTENQQFEPGSIMLLTSKDPKGEMVYNVMMVTPDQNTEPVQLNSDTMESLKQAVQHHNIGENISDALKRINTQNILKITARPIEEDDDENIVSSANNDENNVTITVPEQNITIPAESTVQLEANVPIDMSMKTLVKSSNSKSSEPKNITVTKTNEIIQDTPEDLRTKPKKELLTDSEETVDTSLNTKHIERSDTNPTSGLAEETSVAILDESSKTTPNKSPSGTVRSEARVSETTLPTRVDDTVLSIDAVDFSITNNIN